MMMSLYHFPQGPRPRSGISLRRCAPPCPIPHVTWTLSTWPTRSAQGEAITTTGLRWSSPVVTRSKRPSMPTGAASRT